MDDPYYCQLGAVAVLMGDKSAVTVIQEAHARILLRAGVGQAHELIGGGGSRLDSETLSDVYIDDLIALCCTEQMSVPLELAARLALATGSKIIPIAVASGRCWPRKSWRFTPGVIDVSIGEPMGALVGESPIELMVRVEMWVETEMRVIDPLAYGQS